MKPAMRTPLFILLFMTAVKIIFLLGYGPIYAPDSVGYTAFADRILTETDWLHYVDLTDYWYPDTAFRAIGYPAVIALTKLVAGQSFDWLLVIIQIGFSLYISWIFYVLAFEVSGRSWVASLVMVSHGMGQGILLDQAVLTDSLNASLLLCMTILIAMKVVRNCPVKLIFLIGMGGAMTLAFLIREAGVQLQFLYWILLIWWFIQSKTGWKRSLICLMAFVLPLQFAVYGYKSWNEYRTGERFVTTAGQTSMFFPVLELKKRGIEALADDPLLKDMQKFYEPFDKVPPLRNISLINNHLVTEHGMNAAEMARYSFTKFKELWLTYPRDMLMVTLSHIREKQAFLAFMPFEAMMSIDFWATGIKPFQKKRDLFEKVQNESRYDLLAAYIGRHICRVLAIVITIAFVFAVPVMILRQLIHHKFKVNQFNQKDMLIFVFWLIYFGYTSAYAMVSLEMRYLMPVVPFSTLAGLYMLLSPVENLAQKLRNLKIRGSN